MPRDLFPSRAPANQEPTLVASPEMRTPTPTTNRAQVSGNEMEPDEDASPQDEHSIYRQYLHEREMQLSGPIEKPHVPDRLHPYVQVLSIADLEGCMALEQACFPEHERCSKEKVGLDSCSCSLCFSISKVLIHTSSSIGFSIQSFVLRAQKA
jgi:hypothetical protein